MKKSILLAFVLLFTVTAANARPYTVEHTQSSITFSGQHAGKDFQGVFKEWSAEIDFDPGNLGQSKARVTIDLKNADTGNAMYDGALPTADWFNVKEYPQATFVANTFTANDDGSYSAAGELTLKGMTHALSFDFRLEGEKPTRMTASFPVHRLDYGIGIESDPSAEWVSEIIQININIAAH